MIGQKITLVAAKDKNNAIGIDNQMPWHIPEDFAFFKEYTMGKPIIMGRKTWESLPKNPLPGRRNLVVTRNDSYKAKGAEIFSSLAKALEACAKEPEICIVGGAEIYQQGIDLATDLMVTEVDLEVSNANRFFPVILDHRWKSVVLKQKEKSIKGLSFDLIHYTRL
ncbi:MAG: dihydrofolate reductase [Neisseriaceae bacterium]|nr:dihydrofolate reductase [Neisseriaceae bacterium PsAf]MCV2503595.1 dihydrofolate reductase [Neisseriaceae bacterium]MCV2509041.1 dihydrofolate reductase [Neisseriaceae bacterium]